MKKYLFAPSIAALIAAGSARAADILVADSVPDYEAAVAAPVFS